MPSAPADERIHHWPDQRAFAEAGMRRQIESRNERASVVCRVEHGRLDELV